MLNFGYSGRAVTRPEDIVQPDPSTEMGKQWFPYWETCDYHQVMKSEPDVVVMMLGTNDMLHSGDPAANR